jgi:hypothetical protein
VVSDEPRAIRRSDGHSAHARRGRFAAPADPRARRQPRAPAAVREAAKLSGSANALAQPAVSALRYIAYSLIARLHEQGVPVIMISGSSDSPSGLPVEAATILEKPVSEARLLASLRPLLTRKDFGEG